VSGRFTPQTYLLISKFQNCSTQKPDNPKQA